MRLLAIETATNACSCALILGDEREQRFRVAPRQHAELVLEMVSDLLESAGVTLSGLDAIAFGRGPGSFTGVRIATSVAQGLGLAADLPLVPVSSLGALALASSRRHGGSAMLAAFDARMDEVYWGAFDTSDSDNAVLIGAEYVDRPASVPVPDSGQWRGAGEGWSVYGDVLQERLEGRLCGVDTTAFPGAAEVAAIAGNEWRAGRWCAPELARPVYLRDRVTGRAPESPRLRPQSE